MTFTFVGPPHKLNHALKTITQKISERGVTEEDYKAPEPLDASKITTKVKFLYSEDACSYLLDKKMSEELRSIEERNGVRIKVSSSRSRIKH
jgi:hypothetical protein